MIQQEEVQLLGSDSSLKIAENKESSVKGKSSQLKTFLGVQNANQNSASKSVPSIKGGNNSSTESTVQNPEFSSKWGSSGAVQKGGNPVQTLKQIQEEEEKARLLRETLQQQQLAASLAISVAAAPKWNTGGSATANKNSKPPSQSLDEIMQQEELVRQQQLAAGGLTSNPGVRVMAPAGSWAAKAAKAAPGSSFTPIPISPVLKVSTGSVGSKPASIQKEVESFWNFSDNKSDAKISSVGSSEKSVLGETESSIGGMPPAFAEWSISELKKLSNKNDHLALIQLCYTLESAVEIREYFAEYLGSTPQVFIICFGNVFFL